MSGPSTGPWAGCAWKDIEELADDLNYYCRPQAAARSAASDAGSSTNPAVAGAPGGLSARADGAACGGAARAATPGGAAPAGDDASSSGSVGGVRPSWRDVVATVSARRVSRRWRPRRQWR